MSKMNEGYLVFNLRNHSNKKRFIGVVVAGGFFVQDKDVQWGSIPFNPEVVFRIDERGLYPDSVLKGYSIKGLEKVAKSFKFN